MIPSQQGHMGEIQQGKKAGSQAWMPTVPSQQVSRIQAVEQGWADFRLDNLGLARFPVKGRYNKIGTAQGRFYEIQSSVGIYTASGIRLLFPITEPYMVKGKWFNPLKPS